METRVISDLNIGGYHIPAGTTVQMNLYSVLRGDKYFKDPHAFRPERFINDQGKITIPDAFIPFGYGEW